MGFEPINQSEQEPEKQQSPSERPSLKPEPMQPGEAVDFGSNDGSHLDDLIAEAEAAEAETVADTAQGVEPENVAGRLSPDQFFAAFRGMFGAPNLFLKPPLASLAIDEGDQAARAASDALYETCLDVPWLNFLIEPGNVWAGRAIVIGAFAFGQGSAIRAELAERRAGPRQDSRGAVAGGPDMPQGARGAPEAPTAAKPVIVDGQEYAGVLGEQVAA